MPSKREIVELLTPVELRAVVDRLALDVTGATGAEDAGSTADEALVECVTAAKKATLPKILAELSSDRLRALCRATGVDDEGERKVATLIRRLIKTDSSTRLFGLVARDVRTAVIFRRGPSKQVRMILWDLATDTLTLGQWLSGRIYDERCGISPDGKLVVYFAGKFKTKLGTFTAVSRPPYFTALALWPDGSTWGGGGFFEERRKLILNYGRVIKELNDNAKVPASFVVSHVTEYRARHGAEPTAVSQQGWTLKSKGGDGAPTPEMHFVYSPPWVYEKPHPVRPGVRLERSKLGMFEVNGPSHVYSYRLLEPVPIRPKANASARASGGVDRDLATELGRHDWADWDHDGSLLYSEGGRLYRRDLAARGRGPDAGVKLVADLSDQVFANVLPPDEARVWP